MWGQHGYSYSIWHMQEANVGQCMKSGATKAENVNAVKSASPRP